MSDHHNPGVETDNKPTPEPNVNKKDFFQTRVVIKTVEKRAFIKNPQLFTE